MGNAHEPVGSGRVLVTGAVGNVGREVVRALVARGTATRAVDLSDTAVRAMHGDAGEAGVLDYADRATFKGALEGCSSLFLVRPPAVACMESTLLPFIDAAMESG